MRVTVTKSIELDYGHSLPNHYGFCNQLHGHRAVVTATVAGPIQTGPNTSSEGMVMDFSLIKTMMMSEIHDKLDHGFAIWKDDPDLNFITKRNKRFLITAAPPTAETLAQWAFRQLAAALPPDVYLERIRWYETPSSYAEVVNLG